MFKQKMLILYTGCRELRNPARDMEDHFEIWFMIANEIFDDLSLGGGSIRCYSNVVIFKYIKNT